MEELPLGFSMAPGQHPEAMARFSALSEAEQQAIVEGTHAVRSKRGNAGLRGRADEVKKACPLCQHSGRFFVAYWKDRWNRAPGAPEKTSSPPSGRSAEVSSHSTEEAVT